MQDIKTQLHATRVLPVLTVSRIRDAVPLARALQRGGLNAVEITLRSDVALAAVTEVVAALPDMVVGVGSVRNAAQLEAAAQAGATYAVSPGASLALLKDAADAAIPMLPGAATPSEMMTLAEHGYLMQKYFPAEAMGGAAVLKSVSGPLPDLRFCPTGGIDSQRAVAYLGLPSVFCVGGSWMVPNRLIEAGDWAAIEDLARQAAAL